MAEPAECSEEIEMILDAISVPMVGLTPGDGIRNRFTKGGGMKMVKVYFSDFTTGEYDDARDAEDAILEALAEGVLPEEILEDDDPERMYSCIWKVRLQGEF